MVMSEALLCCHETVLLMWAWMRKGHVSSNWLIENSLMHKSKAGHREAAMVRVDRNWLFYIYCTFFRPSVTLRTIAPICVSVCAKNQLHRFYKVELIFLTAMIVRNWVDLISLVSSDHLDGWKNHDEFGTITKICWRNNGKCAPCRCCIYCCKYCLR